MALFASAQFQKQLKQLCVYHPAVSVLNLQHDVQSKHLTRNTNLDHQISSSHLRVTHHFGNHQELKSPIRGEPPKSRCACDDPVEHGNCPGQETMVWLHGEVIASGNPWVFYPQIVWVVRADLPWNHCWEFHPRFCSFPLWLSIISPGNGNQNRKPNGRISTD